MRKNIWKKNTRQSRLINRCLLAVRDLPLERFRLPRDGRKWRQLARARAALLEHLASFANPDGTFTRDAINYSPSTKRLTRRFAERSFYRHASDLRELGLLTWTRFDHYHKRTYIIHPNAPQNHLPDSADNHPPDSKNTCHNGRKNTCHSCADVPSLEEPW
jgi:hypothetical protein